jgi:hypothetical protein
MKGQPKPMKMQEYKGNMSGGMKMAKGKKSSMPKKMGKGGKKGGCSCGK